MLLIRINKKGLSLTELLVATVLMGIVMMGVISINYAMRRMEGTTSKSTVLAIQTAAAMNHITKNGLLAVGFESDPGIVLQLTTPPAVSYLSFRQDINGTPGNFSDDLWVIYTDGGQANELYTCTQDAGTGPIPNTGSGGRCETTGNLVLLNNVSAINYQLVRDATTHSTYVDIDIQTQADVTQPADPIRNPTYELTVQISPPFHSWAQQ